MRVTKQEELIAALRAGAISIELEGDLAKTFRDSMTTKPLGSLSVAIGGATGFLLVTSIIAPVVGIGIAGGILGGVLGGAATAAVRKLIAAGKNPELLRLLEKYEVVPGQGKEVILKKREKK